METFDKPNLLFRYQSWMRDVNKTEKQFIRLYQRLLASRDDYQKTHNIGRQYDGMMKECASLLARGLAFDTDELETLQEQHDNLYPAEKTTAEYLAFSFDWDIYAELLYKVSSWVHDGIHDRYDSMDDDKQEREGIA